jgi:hypothetical protein
MAPLPRTIKFHDFYPYMLSGLAAYLVSFAIGMAPLPWTINPMIFTLYMLSGLAAYLVSFAIGMAPLPWTINSEIFPTWARSTATSITTGKAVKIYKPEFIDPVLAETSPKLNL